MTSPDIVVHVGLPKTASTFLQEAVFPKIGAIRYLGKQLALRERLGRAYGPEALPVFLAALLRESITYRGEDQRVLFERRIAPALDAARPNLISEETLADGATDRGIVARRLLDAMGPVRFLVAIRRQQDMAESMYSDFVKRIAAEKTRFLSFPEWLDVQWRRLHGSWSEPSELVRFRYYELISYYARLVGRENVGVLVFEEIREAPRRFAGRLARFLDADAAEIEMLLRQPLPPDANVRLTRAQLLAASVMSRLSLPRGAGNLMPAPVKALARAVLDGRAANPIRLPAEWSERIAGLCREGNARLAAEWGLPLDAYGYFV